MRKAEPEVWGFAVVDAAGELGFVGGGRFAIFTVKHFGDPTLAERAATLMAQSMALTNKRTLLVLRLDAEAVSLAAQDGGSENA